MKFEVFVKNCVKLLEEKPEVGEYDTVYAHDDEGNGFQVVGWEPTLGIREDGGYTFEFIALESLREEPEEYDYTEKDLNAVCIN